MKKKNETMLIPLIEMENKKLDVKLIKKALLGKKGQSTSLGDNINLFMWSERFEEQNKSQVYKLYAEITIHLYKAKEKYERDIYADVIIAVIVANSIHGKLTTIFAVTAKERK